MAGRIYKVGGKPSPLYTLREAQRKAESIHRATGAFVSIEMVPARSAEEYRRQEWYAMGARFAPFAAAYRGSSQDGTDCRMAYNAGVIARLFGISLHHVVN